MGVWQNRFLYFGYLKWQFRLSSFIIRFYKRDNRLFTSKKIYKLFIYSLLFYYNPTTTADCRTYIFSLVQCVFVIPINLQLKGIFLCHVINCILYNLMVIPHENLLDLACLNRLLYFEVLKKQISARTLCDLIDFQEDT